MRFPFGGASRLGASQAPYSGIGILISGDVMLSTVPIIEDQSLTGAGWWARERSRTLNLGAGRAISLREIVDAFVAQGLQVTWIDAPEQADIGLDQTHGRQTMSIRRISSDAGWQPASTPRLSVAEMCT